MKLASAFRLNVRLNVVKIYDIKANWCSNIVIRRANWPSLCILVSDVTNYRRKRQYTW